MTNRERMKKGLWYDANYDRELLEMRNQADDLCFEFNNIRPRFEKERQRILKKLMPDLGENVSVLAPINADYGTLTRIGDETFINHNAYFMDGGTITIGSHCFIGPNCGLYTANHPLLAQERNQGYETARPIVIEDNVWIGADVTILPGVTIGAGSVIGAKSLVNKDIPDHVLAVGNPCKVLRKISEKDSIKDLLEQ
ncbi:MAG: sugar O-acetyltransferase [Allobaculum sp.]